METGIDPGRSLRRSRIHRKEWISVLLGRGGAFGSCQGWLFCGFSLFLCMEFMPAVSGFYMGTTLLLWSGRYPLYFFLCLLVSLFFLGCTSFRNFLLGVYLFWKYFLRPYLQHQIFFNLVFYFPFFLPIVTFDFFSFHILIYYFFLLIIFTLF